MPKRWAWVEERRFCHAFSIKPSVFRRISQGKGETRCVRGDIGSLSLSLKENRYDQDRKNIDDLDHRIDRRACGIFVGITDGVPGNCRLVREGTFAPKIAFLDELLGVVPRAATGSHCY